MRAAEGESTDECPVKMKLVAPPLYVLNTTTLDKDQVGCRFFCPRSCYKRDGRCRLATCSWRQGVEVLNRACGACKASVESRKGRLQVKEAARAVSERDDRFVCFRCRPCLQSSEHCTPHVAVTIEMVSSSKIMLRRMLSLQLATLEAQNKEVAGDDDAEEEDEGMGALDVEAPALQVE